MDNKKLVGMLCVLGSTVCYGLVPSFSFMAFRIDVATETLLFNKFLYAAVLMWGYILLRGRRWQMSFRAARATALVAAAYIGISTSQYLAFDYLSGSLATIISFTFPAMVITVEMASGREKVSAAKIGAVLLSITGLCFIVGSPDAHIRLIGVVFALLCAVCYTVYTIGLSSPALGESHAFVTAGYVLLGCTVFNAIRCLLSGKPLLPANAAQLGLMLVLAIVCTFSTIVLFCLGVRMVGASQAAIVNTFEPIFACVFDYLLVGDQITEGMIIGVLLVVGAVLVSHLPHRRAS